MRKRKSKSTHFLKGGKKNRTVQRTIPIAGSAAVFLFLIFNCVEGIFPRVEKATANSVALEYQQQSASQCAAGILQLRQTCGNSQFAALAPAGSSQQLFTSTDGINWVETPREPSIFGPFLPLSVAYWCLWQLLELDLALAA